jgi:ATP-binding cassette subfamily B multidrug efflux pump
MNIYKIIAQYLKHHIGLTVFSILIIVADVSFTLVPPLILKYVIDNLILSQSSNNTLALWSLLYMLSYVLFGVFEFLKSAVLVKISQGICKDLRISILDHIHKMPYEDLSNYEVGTIESLINNDVNTINTLVSNGVISMLIDTFKMVGVFISIFVLSVPIGYIILGVSPLIVLFILLVRKKMYTSKLKSKKIEADVNQCVLEGIENIESIQSYDGFEYINSRYDTILRNHFDTQGVSIFYDSIFSPVMQMTRYLIIATILTVSVYYPNMFGITIGTFLSVSDLLSALFTPMENIGMELQTLQDSAASITRINNFQNTKEESRINSIKETNNLSLEFRNVSYYYNKSEQIIKNLNLVLSNGEKLTLKGESGAGKSTIFKLGYGLIKPREGEVCINNIPVNSINENTRRELFGIVYQDCFFSGGTIKEEITLFNTKYSDKDVYTVLNKLGMTRIKDINTPLREKDFSSGELSLFNIARILISKPKIIFLDEMNSKIDPITANQIIDILNKECRNSTILSITHYGKNLNNSREMTITALR